MELVAINVSGAPVRAVGELVEAALQSLAATAIMYRESGFEPPWIGYLAVESGVGVGTCAFKSAPRDGRVELAYFTFPGHEGRGLATRMCTELVTLARMAQPDIVITAQTRPERSASTRVLEKSGFRLVGARDHPEDGRVWEWQLTPPATAQSVRRP